MFSRKFLCPVLVLVVACTMSPSIIAGTLTTSGNQFLLDDRPFAMWGIRVASASQTDERCTHLIRQLDDYKKYGINTVTVFYQGSKSSHANPFSEDGATISPDHQARMEKIIQECDKRSMVVVVGIFYQRAASFGSVQGWENAVRTVATKLLPYGNVIINIANEQNSKLYQSKGNKDIFDINDPEKIIHLVDIVHQVDSKRLAGGGGYNHASNEIIGRSASVNVLLFDTNGPEDCAALFDRFTAAGVVGKPMVNVELFGDYTTSTHFPKTPGEYTDANKLVYKKAVDAAVSKPGLYVFFFDGRWLQGANEHATDRYDLAGSGSPSDVGIRWYAEYVQAKIQKTP